MSARTGPVAAPDGLIAAVLLSFMATAGLFYVNILPALVDGLKTGHAELAGYGITASAKQGDRRLILVINGLPDDKARVEEGEKLMLYGLREFTDKLVARKDQVIDSADVWFGKKEQVGLVSEKDVLVTMPANTPAGIKFTVKYTGPLEAPIKKGAHVADLTIAVPNQAEQTVALVAAEDVEKLSGFGRIWAVINHYVLHRS